MAGTLNDTSERIIPGRQVSLRQHLLYLRHRFAYEYAADRIPPEALTLEVGCGEGYGVELLSRRIGSVVGLDVDARAVRHAAQKYGAPNRRFEGFDGMRIPFSAGHFGAVLSFQVIEHVDAAADFVAELSRVLEPGGVAYLTTPNRLLRLAPGEAPWNRHHVREYDPPEFEALLRAAFSEVRVFGVRSSPEVEGIEHGRLRSIRKWVRFDPLGLRDRLPERLGQGLRRLLEATSTGLPGARRGASELDRFEAGDFRTSDVDLEESLDLLAVCRSAR